MTPSRIAPAVAFAWTLVCVAGVVLFRSVPELGWFTLCILTLTSVCTRGLSIPRIALELTVPFALPLAVVHGVLNPQFAVSDHFLGYIPLRPSGLGYSLFISLRILVLSSAAVMWRFVDADRLMREAVHIGLPRSAVVTLAVALATMRIVPNKIKAVYLAQQARGMPSGPGLSARIRALPSVVIPVIVATILEGASRGTLMISRGLGSAAFRMPLLMPMITRRDIDQMLLGVLILILPFLVRL